MLHALLLKATLHPDEVPNVSMNTLSTFAKYFTLTSNSYLQNTMDGI